MDKADVRVSISAQGEALVLLSKRASEIRSRMEALCSQLGLLSQEYLILNEAMRVTLEDLNNAPVAPFKQTSFPELHSYD
jgi:hypothetical protein